MIAAITGKQLLLPNITVAEVIEVDGIQAPASGSPAWYMGTVNWQNAEVPVIAFEGMNGQAVPNAVSRIAILNGISAQRELPFYGIVVQADPRIAKVKIAELEDLESAPVGPVEFLQVRYAGELAVIPDLDLVESKILAQ
jgi:chemosensory pili system protein ChpC